jgi:hypothetical protein
LGIDLSSYSPAVLKQIIYAGVHHPSYEQASGAMKHLAHQEVSAKQVERLTRRIGEERCDERDAEVRAYQALPLVQRKDKPTGATAPDLAVVQTDGGRLQILDRSAAGQEAEKSSDGHWREDKVGLLATMTSVESAGDPCPTIPETFVDPLRILKLTREIKGSAGITEEEVPAESSAAAEAATAYLAPKLEHRSVVATRQDAYGFGQILSQAAWERGFYGATRRAFVADGSSTNWGIWERHFSNFEPIVDFVHAVTYVFSAAMAGRPFVEGWTAYTDWIGQVWVGKIEPVITALKQRQEVLGPAREDDADTSPRSLVARALEYLGNQKGRMQYAKYRQQGLPITSCHVESTIKQINRRVKGTEKFWSESGAEAILQLRADALSETEPLEAFWQRRQDNATGERRYSKAA